MKYPIGIFAATLLVPIFVLFSPLVLLIGLEEES